MDHLIRVQITRKVFQEFAWFDMLYQQKKCQTPVVFTAIMAVFAAISFSMVGQVQGAGLLGGVLLGIGTVLPLGWLLSFCLSVRAEARRFDSPQLPVAYTLRLTNQGLGVSNEKEQVELAWEQLLCAYRLRHSICIYVAPQRAYLLPNCTETDKIWLDLCGKLPGRARRVRSRP